MSTVKLPYSNTKMSSVKICKSFYLFSFQNVRKGQSRHSGKFSSFASNIQGGATTFSITTLSIMTLSLMTLSIMGLFATFSIMTLSIMGLFFTLSIIDTEHK